MIHRGPLSYNKRNNIVYYKGRAQTGITPNQLKILGWFIEHKTVSPNALDFIGEGETVTSGSATVQLCLLRKKLPPDINILTINKNTGRVKTRGFIKRQDIVYVLEIKDE